MNSLSLVAISNRVRQLTVNWIGVVAILLLSACANEARLPTSTAPATSTAATRMATLDDFPLSVAGPPPGATPRAWELTAALNRGVNFGNMLDSPKEGDWGLKVEQRFIELTGRGGFTSSVRLPVRWSNHASLDANATIDPVFLQRVESIVAQLLARGNVVILNMHHYRQLDGDKLDPGEAAVEPSVVRVRALSIWQQLSERFAKYDDRLIFEVYNEPHGAQENTWNDLLSRAVRLIRKTNPNRMIVLGPTEWNAAHKLPQLILPPDRNLILTVHHYEPFDFTHQGAEWINPMRPLGLTCCTPEMKRKIVEPLDLAAAASKRLNYPIFIGEFGAYSKAPLEARVNYLREFESAARNRHIPWIYWELASGFGLYDPQANAFRPHIFEALYGSK
jgi:endoglucanase